MSDAPDTIEKKGAAMAHTQLTADLVGGEIIVTGSTATKHVGKGSPPEVFTFSLTDNTNCNVCFLPAPDFLGIDETGGCPSAPGINTDQVDPKSVKRPNPQTAQFTDSNSRACTLGYALFFSSDGPPVKPFDPIIINEGQ